MRKDGRPSGARANALWGQKGSEGRRRASSLVLALAGVILLMLAVPLVAAAGEPGKTTGNGHGADKGAPGNGRGQGGGHSQDGSAADSSGGATSGSGSGSGSPASPGGDAAAQSSLPDVPSSLLASAQSHPDSKYRVIVESRGTSAGAAARITAAIAARPGSAKGLTRRFATLAGAAAVVTGRQLVVLAHDPRVLSVTPDARIRMAGGGLSNTQQWPYQAQLSKFWDQIQTTGVQAPTVAIVDTGVDATRPDFGNRVVQQVNLASLAPNSPGDGRGHGTFVAGILAGSQAGYTGGAPNAKIVSLDVMNDQGMALTSDVIAAVDWIYRNKDTYKIRVANFSLHSSTASSFMYDPLDKAVEKLWFSGVVVVTAAGNYAANGQPSGVLYAPGNDPFVITAGAADIEGTMASSDDINAPWSAYGYTPDGFMKPDVGAPGRYIVGPVPPASTLVAEKPANVVGNGYMQLSGTSFAAPVVAAAADFVLAMHPTWTPDQVKGALMVSAGSAPSAAARSLGVGEVKAQSAVNVTTPPNPNKALDGFLVPDPSGSATPVFDAVGWSNMAQANVSWDAVSWGDSAWSSAAWSSVSWGDISWSDSSWASVSWGDSTASTASTDVSWADNGSNDFLRGGYKMSLADYAAIR